MIHFAPFRDFVVIAVLSQRSLNHSDPPTADTISLLIIHSASMRGWIEKLPEPLII